MGIVQKILERLERKGAASGYAGVDAGSRIAMANMPAGTSGQVLTAQGAAADPAYAAGVAISTSKDVSEVLRNSNDAEKSTSSAWPNSVKIKETKLNAAYNGLKIRIKLDVRSSAEGQPVWWFVKRNGEGITGSAMSSATYATFSHDIDASNWVANDLIQIAAMATAGYTVYVRNVRFYYSYCITGFGGDYVLTSPIPILGDPTISMTNQDP